MGQTLTEKTEAQAQLTKALTTKKHMTGCCGPIEMMRINDDIAFWTYAVNCPIREIKQSNN